MAGKLSSVSIRIEKSKFIGITLSTATVGNVISTVVNTILFVAKVGFRRGDGRGTCCGRPSTAGTYCGGPFTAGSL